MGWHIEEGRVRIDARGVARLEEHLRSDAAWDKRAMKSLFERLEERGWKDIHLCFAPADVDSNGGLWFTAQRAPTFEDIAKHAEERAAELARHLAELRWHESQIETLQPTAAQREP